MATTQTRTTADAECAGNRTLSTNVDGEMDGWVRQRAERAGVTPTELLRRLLDYYRGSANGDVVCPSCGAEVPLHAGVER